MSEVEGRASMERLYLCDGCGKDVWVVLPMGAAPDAVEATGDIRCCDSEMWHRATTAPPLRPWPSGLPTWTFT